MDEFIDLVKLTELKEEFLTVLEDGLTAMKKTLKRYEEILKEIREIWLDSEGSIIEDSNPVLFFVHVGAFVKSASFSPLLLVGSLWTYIRAPLYLSIN
ncbi:UNVERIFIED_CONTAM: hypothetical protein Sradi_4928100 [Sesamum radiatum]|uniref:Uncharacterized protein n=1 Tax=Sesamum radiatum TaxID=300843 RepID=A0AAW2MD27_SESRA